MKKIALTAVVTGGIVEWFDYLLYAFFAPVFAKQIFPTNNQELALILSYIVFTSGFFIRPIGGAYIGTIADRFGRRKALLFTIFLMCCSTLSMAILPGYAVIGILSPIILLLIRITQSFAVSGELNSAACYLLEHAPKHKECLYTSLTSASASLGICLGAFVTFITHHFLNDEALASWGWRAAFLLATILGLLSGLLRYIAEESSTFSKVEFVKTSLIAQFSQFKTQIIYVILLSAPLCVGNYYLFAFINIYLIDVMHFAADKIYIANTIIILMSVFFIPVCALLADRFGAVKIFKMGLSGFITLTLPIFFLFSQNHIIWVYISQFVYVALLSMVAATVPTLMLKKFPMSYRTTGSALAYNLSQACFGGTAPVIALWLNRNIHFSLAPSLYLSGIAAISLSYVLSCERVITEHSVSSG